MSGLFNTLNTANKGLMSQQTSLHTVGHNISNANTRGYSRQRVELKADKAYNLPGVGQLGTGVKMESIIRITSEFVNRQIREENGVFNKYLTQSETLDSIEMLFNEPSDSGINAQTSKVFEAWAELSKYPELSTSKTVVVEQSQSLADTINHTYNRLDALKGNIGEEVDVTVNEFNSYLERLEDINNQISNLSIKGGTPNDLLDQRDLLLADMSEMANFKVGFDRFGRASVSVGESELVGFEGLKEEFSLDNPKHMEGLREGSIKGKLDSIKDVDKNMESLSNFAKGFAKAINLVHSDGEDPDNGFFTISESDKGFSINVKDELRKDPNKVNAGVDENSGEGDGSRASAISRLNDIKLDFENLEMVYNKETMEIEGSKNGSTIYGEYGSMISQIGIDKNKAIGMVENQAVLLEQLDARRESESGVSLNEEVSNIIKFQSAYEANAKVISTVAEMLDTLINRTGI